MVAANQVQKLTAHNNKFNGGNSKKQEMKFVLDWLDQFGYFKKPLSDWKNITVGDIVDAVRKWQSFYHLKKDGYIGPKSLRAMMQPRCGCPDMLQADRPDHIQFMKARKVARNLAKWNKRKLRYFIRNRVGGIAASDFDTVIDAAFQAWEDHCGLQVERINDINQADIVVDIGRGRGMNFDGPGGTLAWAYLPTGFDRQLLMRFDLDETWILDQRMRGILLFNVACHEIGHLLGLEHSRAEGALMAPYYNPAIAVPQLVDDIPRIQARYGQPTGNPSVPPSVPSLPPGGNGREFSLRCRDLEVEGYTLFAN